MLQAWFRLRAVFGPQERAEPFEEAQQVAEDGSQSSSWR